jgi:hypothetical protein
MPGCDRPGKIILYAKPALPCPGRSLLFIQYPAKQMVCGLHIRRNRAFRPAMAGDQAAMHEVILNGHMQASAHGAGSLAKQCPSSKPAISIPYGPQQKIASRQVHTYL